MRTLRGWMKRMRGMFGQDAADRALNDEIESHIALAIEDRVRSGMSEADARREVLMQFHGVEASKQRYREQRGVPAIEHFVYDVRYALRAFRKDKAFAVVATIVLTLGMLAALSIFALVDAALLKPLPYAHPERLVFVTGSVEGLRRANISYLDYLDWKQQTKTFSSLDVHTSGGFLLANDRGSELVTAGLTSAGFFRTLGVKPILGRDFYDNEDAPQATPVLILSYGAWKTRFGGRSEVIGKTVNLDGMQREIVGVLPPDFTYAMLGGAEFWTQLQRRPDSNCMNRRSCHNLYGVARLKDGESVATAFADLNVITKRLEQQYPDSNRGRTGWVQDLTDSVVGTMRPILAIMLGGALLLLVIACVNVSSLLLVRSEHRKREIAVRMALGASPFRLMRQFIAEGVVLGGTATVIALAATAWTLRVIVGLVPQTIALGMPFLRVVGINAHVIVAAAMLLVLVITIFSAVPLLRLRLSEMQEGLKQGTQASAGKRWRRFAGNLVVVELAVTMMLLVGAGLLTQSLYRLLHVDLGFDAENLVVIGGVVFPDTDYPTKEKMVSVRKAVIDAVQQVPGVESAAMVSQLPVEGNGNTTWIRVVGHPYNGEHNETNERDVSAGFFNTIRASIRQGRWFTEEEDLRQAKVAIVNQAFVNKYLPGEDPLGKKVAQVSQQTEPVEVIGVVNNIRESSLDEETWPTIYLLDPDGMPSLLVKTKTDPAAMVPVILNAIHQVNANIGTTDYSSMTQRINRSQTAYIHRASAVLVGAFAMTALVLSVIGLYGVIAYSVGQRTKEIGIRMALGARRGNIYRLVLTEAGWLVVFGVIAGVIGAALTSKMMRALLFGVGSGDVRTFTGVVALLALAAMMASYFPARKAASVDPMNVLRAE